MDDLKDYDDKLIYLVIFNIALSLLINNFNILIKNNDLILSIVSVPVLYFPVYIINNIIPREWKFILLYPEKELHKFASDIFSRLLSNELSYDKNLIDVNLIIKTYGNPKYADEEDKLWYEIYNKHRYDKKIYQQNKQFLLCRDYFVFVLIMTISCLVISPIFGFNSIILTLIFIGIIEFILLGFLARRFNEKFALSVLQEETNFLRKNKNMKIFQSTQYFSLLSGDFNYN